MYKKITYLAEKALEKQTKLKKKYYEVCNKYYFQEREINKLKEMLGEEYIAAYKKYCEDKQTYAEKNKILYGENRRLTQMVDQLLRETGKVI